MTKAKYRVIPSAAFRKRAVDLIREVAYSGEPMDVSIYGRVMARIIPLPFTSSLTGVKYNQSKPKVVSVRIESCEYCKGKGSINGSTCLNCEGEGRVRWS